MHKGCCFSDFGISLIFFFSFHESMFAGFRLFLGPFLRRSLALQSWHSFGFTGTDPKEFLVEFADVWELVLPGAETQRVMKLESGKKLSAVKEEINLLYQSSDAGKALFSSAIKGIACEDLDTKIKAGLDKLDGTAGIEEVELAAWLNKMYEEVNKIPGIECLQGRRAVKMTYRKLTISVMVADPAEQVTLSLRLRVRERAAISDIIALLPGEGVLDAGQDHPWTSGTSAVSKAHKARLQLTRLLQAEPEDTVSGDTVLVPS